MARNVTTNINPQTTSGTQLSVFINDNTQAWLTHHTGGPLRPSYMIAPGGIWVDNVSEPGQQILYYFDGSSDIRIGIVFNGQLFLDGGTIIFKQPLISVPDDNITRINHFWYQTDTEEFFFLTSKEPDVWVLIGSGGNGGGGGVLESADDEMILPLPIVDGNILTFPNTNGANGLVKLDAAGLVPLALLPFGGLNFLGAYDIQLGTPAPAAAAGDYFLGFNGPGLINGQNAESGDTIIWDGAQWNVVSDADISLASLTAYDNNTSTLVAVEVSSALNELDGKVEVNKGVMDGHLGQANIHFVIDDLTAASNSTWSGAKISADIGTVGGSLNSHIGNAGIHFVIDDASNLTNVAWSGFKITNEFDARDVTFANHVNDVVIHNRAGNNNPLRQFRVGEVDLVAMIKVNTANQVELAMTGVLTNVVHYINIKRPSDFWASESFYNVGDIGWMGTNGSFAISITSNAYRNTGGSMTSMGANGNVGVSQFTLYPNGYMEFRSNTATPTGASPSLRLTYNAGVDRWQYSSAIEMSDDTILGEIRFGTFGGAIGRNTATGSLRITGVQAGVEILGAVTMNAGLTVAAGVVAGNSAVDTRNTFFSSAVWAIGAHNGTAQVFFGATAGATPSAQISNNAGVAILTLADNLVSTFHGSLIINGASTTVNGTFNIPNGGLAGSGLFFVRSGAPGQAFWKDVATDWIEMKNVNNAGLRFVVSGTTIAFEMSAAGNVSSPGAISATGNITAFSDRTVKTEMKVIEDALEKVKKLTGYTFRRTDLLKGRDKSRYASVIAQDVQRVLPEAVRLNGKLSLDNAAVVGLLVNAINELEEKFNDFAH